MSDRDLSAEVAALFGELDGETYTHAALAEDTSYGVQARSGGDGTAKTSQYQVHLRRTVAVRLSREHSMPSSAIARALGVDISTVKRYLAQGGVPSTHRPRPIRQSPHHAAVVAAVTAGEPVAQVARRHDLGSSAAYAIVAKAGHRLGSARCGAPGRVKNNKVPVDAVHEIRASTEPGAVLAARYGVTPAAVSAIRNGRSFRSVPWRLSLDCLDTRG